MSNVLKAQAKIKSLSSWLKARDYCDTRSLAYNLDDAQREIERITNSAIDDTLKNLALFIEQANMDANDSILPARYRQTARTEIRRLSKTKKELEGLKL